MSKLTLKKLHYDPVWIVVDVETGMSVGSYPSQQEASEAATCISQGNPGRRYIVAWV